MNKYDYTPQSFEKHSIGQSFADSLAKTEQNIAPHLPVEQTNKYNEIPVHLPQDNLTHFSRKFVHDTILHANPEHFKSFQLVDTGLNELWGLPSYKIVIEPTGVQEYNMEGVKDTDLMVMRLQNENGTDNKLSQVLDEKGLPSSLDGYFEEMDERIKSKYSKIKLGKNIAIEKGEKKLQRIEKTEADPVIKENRKTTIMNKIARNKEQLETVERAKQQKIDNEITPHKERKLRRKTIVVEPPILNTKEYTPPDSNVSSVKDETTRIENKLDYYRDKLESVKNKRQDYSKVLSMESDNNELIELLKKGNIPMSKFNSIKSVKALLRLIQSLDANPSPEFFVTPPRKSKKYRYENFED